MLWISAAMAQWLTMAACIWLQGGAEGLQQEPVRQGGGKRRHVAADGVGLIVAAGQQNAQNCNLFEGAEA